MSETGSNEGDLLAIRLQRARLLQRKIELLKRYGIAYYRPHPKQDSFHRAFKFKKRMIKAGNRFGKSLMGGSEDVAWLMNERPWYAKDDPARRGGLPQHPTRVLTITTDWDIVNDIWTSQQGEGSKAWKLLPGDFIKSSRKNHSGVIDTFECRNGSLWKFDTVQAFKINPKGSESSDWDAIHVDEPCPRLMYTAASRGLMDRGGSTWFTLTPLEEFWINDMFFPEETGGLARDDVWADTGSTYDNPYLSAEAIAAYERDLTEDEKQCRLHGIPLHLSGLIYKEFRWAEHVLTKVPNKWDAYHRPPKNWPIFVTIDPHPKTPHAVLFCTIDPFGRRYYFYDMFVHCSIEQLVKGDASAGIEGILPFLDGYHVIWAKMDPLGFIEDPITLTTLASETLDAGLYVEKATKALAQGILHVKGELKKRDIVGMPYMVFCPTAKRTLWEIQRYTWDPKKPDSPLDVDDHCMEDLYRMELGGPRWVELSKPSASTIEEDIIDKPLLDLPVVPACEV